MLEEGWLPEWEHWTGKTRLDVRGSAKGCEAALCGRGVRITTFGGAGVENRRDGGLNNDARVLTLNKIL